MKVTKKIKKKDKIIYYILQFTWGLPLNIMGFLVALVLILCGKKPKKHKLCWYFPIGKNWGGLEFGLFFLTDDKENEYILNHEFGHSIQNSWYGPFFLILWILGIIRYNYRQIIKKIKPNKQLSPYYSIWFEKQASILGASKIC